MPTPDPLLSDRKVPATSPQAPQGPHNLPAIKRRKVPATSPKVRRKVSAISPQVSQRSDHRSKISGGFMA